MTRKKTFMQGALILGVAGIIIKMMGAVFRIPLANMIGGEGMAYYQTVYPVYMVFLIIGTAGIPVAISRMVSERYAVGNHAGANKVFRVTFVLMLLIGLFSFIVCFFGAAKIVGMIEGMDQAVYAMKAIAPALLFVPLMAAFRGYFQGMQNMKPTAASQIVEQFFRVVVGLSLAYLFLKHGKQYAAAGASFGATAGSIAGLLFIAMIYLLAKNESKKYREGGLIGEKRDEESSKTIIKKILAIAIPITIGAAIMPIMNLIDVAIVVNRLSATGWSAIEAKSMYGQLTGFAGPLINLPQVLTQAVAMSLVPAVTAAYKLEDTEFLHRNIKLGLRTSIIIGLPASLGMMSLAEPIMLLLYPAQKADAISAAPTLFILAFGVIFLASIQTLSSVLQGVDKQLVPVKNLFIGCIFKVIITYSLTGVPSINIKGAAIGTVVAYIVAMVLNIMAVKKYTGTKFDISLTYFKPFLAALIMSLVAYLTYLFTSPALGNSLATMLAIILAAGTYVLMVLVTGAISEEELSFFPKGNTLIKVFRKFTGKKR